MVEDIDCVLCDSAGKLTPISTGILTPPHLPVFFVDFALPSLTVVSPSHGMSTAKLCESFQQITASGDGLKTF